MKFEEIDIETEKGKALVEKIGHLMCVGENVHKTPQEILDNLCQQTN
jgi:hypothetical protein